MNGRQNAVIIAMLGITGILLLIPATYAQDGQSPLELIVAGLTNQISILDASQSDTQKIVENNTARIASLEAILESYNHTDTIDYSPHITIRSPADGQLLPENTNADQGGVGAKFSVDIFAQRYDGSKIPNSDLTVTLTFHGPDPDHTVSGYYPQYHRGPGEYGPATLAVSYTDVINGQKYTTTEYRHFYIGNDTLNPANAKNYSPDISIIFPSHNASFSIDGSAYEQGTGIALTILATTHDGATIPLDDLTVTQSRASTFDRGQPAEIPNGTASPHFLPALGWLWAVPDTAGPLTITASYTDTVNGKNYTATDSVVIYAKHTTSVDSMSRVSIIAPPDISANATAILTALPHSIGNASALGFADDDNPIITNDAPNLFPIGNTTVTWNATDSSGNSASATQLVSVHENDLDSDWHYVQRGHDGYGGSAAIAATQHLGSLVFSPSDVGSGTIHLFKTFDTSEIKNHSISIKTDTSSPHNVTIRVMDGSYSSNVQSDFDLATGPIPKGGGILASYALSNLPESFTPDWTRAQHNQTTLVISLEKKGNRFVVLHKFNCISRIRYMGI